MDGVLTEKEILSPGYINLKNPKFIEKDSNFLSGLIVRDYPRDLENLLFINLLKYNKDIRMSLFVEKQDFYNTIKSLTYYIGNVGVDLKDGVENREDIDLIAYSYNDAKYIRKEMQINNQELFYIYFYIMVSGKDEYEVENNLKEVEELCIMSGLDVKRSYFRQKELFLSTSPYNLQENHIKNMLKRNILTEGLKVTYPFITSRLIDNNGILIGISDDDNSLVVVDKFNTKK